MDFKHSYGGWDEIRAIRAKVRQWEGLSEGWPVRENTSKWIPQAWRREMLASLREA